MKKVIKLSMIALVASLVVGCATNSDLEKLQSQIDGLKTTAAQLSSDVVTAQETADTAKIVANAAALSAATANNTANHALSVAEDTSAKLDNVFKKAMVK